ncbi:MAG: IPT/TIG domain-containing protein, partial [Ginsengibacter sp.]
YDTIITYDASGNMVKTLKLRPTALPGFDSVTTAGSLGNYYIIYGTNLGSATKLTFNGYNAYFNRALLTDQSIVVQVPSKTPYIHPQANDSLVITTLNGKVSYKFSILPPPPTVSSFSDYNFSAGSQITLTGVGFASVTSVAVSGAGGTGTTSIVSQNDSVLVLTFNAATLTRGILIFTYTAAGTTRTANDTQELVDIDNATQVFTDGYAPSWGSWSWGTAAPSTTIAKTGTTSFAALYGANSWWIDGFRAGGGNATDGFAYTPDYKYLSFWVHGGNADQTIFIEWGNQGFANGGGNMINQYPVPAGKWTYYKIPINNLFWNTSNSNWAANSSQNLNTVGFFMNSNT